MQSKSTTKQCSWCKKERPLTEFYKSKRTRSGLGSWCKRCLYEANRERQTKDRDATREYQRAYREKNADRVKARAKEAHRRYYLANKDAIAERVAKYRAERPEWRKALYRRSAERRKEKRRDYTRQYFQEHPEKAAELASRHRARQQNAVIGQVDYQEVWERDKGICHICGRPVDEGERGFDHVIPLSRGGAHSMDNVKVSHRPCNSSKGTKLMEEL